MSVHELHLDDFMDREIAGTLTPGERAHLDAHLERCLECRLERQLRDDFASDASGDEARLSAFVGGALAAVKREEFPSREEVVPSTRSDGSREASVKESVSSPPRRLVGGLRRRAAFFAAAAMLVAGGAVARSEIPHRFFQAITVAMFGMESSSPTTVVANPSHRAHRNAEEVAPMGPALATNVAIQDTAPLESAAPGTKVEAPIVHDGRPVQTQATRPEELFERATRARRNGELATARRLFAELLARHPSSPEARVSRATLARLALDAGDTATALEGFTSYLASGDGSLREEAMAGRAVALRRLGRSDEERDAWRALVRDYPSSPYGAVAAQRLAVPIP